VDIAQHLSQLPPEFLDLPGQRQQLVAPEQVVQDRPAGAELDGAGFAAPDEGGQRVRGRAPRVGQLADGRLDHAAADLVHLGTEGEVFEAPVGGPLAHAGLGGGVPDRRPGRQSQSQGVVGPIFPAVTCHGAVT
jgi:hypothetical protein